MKQLSLRTFGFPPCTILSFIFLFSFSSFFLSFFFSFLFFSEGRVLWVREGEADCSPWKWTSTFLLNKLDCAFFKYQVYGPMEVDKTSSSSVHQFTITNRYSMPAPVHLQLRQPQPQNNETPAPGIKLGYVLAICVHDIWIKFPIKFIWISIYTSQLLLPSHTEIDIIETCNRLQLQ